jgi:ADP-heptose:LPS heptosyltransferase
MAGDLSSFSPRRILVCQLRQLGDVILTTPAVELLKKRYPKAQLHFFTEKKCAGLLLNNPHIDKVWELDKDKLPTLIHELIWCRRVARTGFDLVADFQQLPRIRWLVAFSRASVRLSYTPPWYTRILYTHSIDQLPGYSAMSKASVLRALGIIWNGERPRLYLTDTEKTGARELLQSMGYISGQVLITVDPTHRRITRRWPLKHYASLMDSLAENPQVRFVPLWGPGEETRIKELIALCNCRKQILLTPAMLNLREMAAIIFYANLHIGNCSAPRHVAVAVDTPSCVALGSTSQVWTFPSEKHVACAADLDCQPCDRNDCSRNCTCLDQLPPELMLAECAKLLAARHKMAGI